MKTQNGLLKKWGVTHTINNRGVIELLLEDLTKAGKSLEDLNKHIPAQAVPDTDPPLVHALPD